MKSYRFRISDYHAIKEADIKLDGITVLSGINGSGKSTIARWLYQVSKVLIDFESMIEVRSASMITNLIKDIYDAASDIDETNSSRKIWDIIKYLLNNPIFDISQYEPIIEDVISILDGILQKNLYGHYILKDLKRYEVKLHVNPESVTGLDEYIKAVNEETYRRYKAICDNAAKQRAERSIDAFIEYLSSILDEDIDNIDFSKSWLRYMENDVDLINGTSFKKPMNLRNVIYINTQQIGLALEPQSHNELTAQLSQKRDNYKSQPTTLVKEISDIIGGDVSIEEGQRLLYTGQNRFTFVRKDGVSFDLRGAATGQISFSYILQLIKNGWIDSDTLLIIDEPESHLHPQWIVDYARMLVMLHKQLGTQIMISSHNPDMVSAIQSLTESEGIQGSTNFYLAEKSEESDEQYIFRAQGDEIGKIFDSFNLALDRISALSH
jgi:hypothetical protein